MNRRRSVPTAASLVAVACTAVALSGCGVLGSGAGGNAAAATRPPTESAVRESAAAVSGLGSVDDAGDLPDPCTLLTEDEVADLTARAVTQIDEDDADPGESTRFCQWQQEGGQLALFLSRTTPADFATQGTEGDPVEGVGDEAFLLASHLYVRHGSTLIDVYSHGGSESENLEDAKEIADNVIPRL